MKSHQKCPATGWKRWTSAVAIAFLLTGCATNRDVGAGDLSPVEPSASEPVTATLQVPEQARAGDRFDALVKLRIAGGHHIYAMTGVREPFAPTKLEFRFPEGIEPLGAYDLPTPATARNGDAIYTGSVIVHQPCRVRPNVSTGRVSIQCEVRYQACTDELCWPPRSIQLVSDINIGVGKGK